MAPVIDILAPFELVVSFTCHLLNIEIVKVFKIYKTLTFFIFT